MNNPNTNLKPSILGVSKSRGEELIQIHPHPSPNPATLQEIVEIKHNRKKQTLTIYTKSQSEARKQLAAAVEKDKIWKWLLEIVEEEWGYALIEMAMEERANVLGISELQGRFFELSNELDAEQQRILSWLLPYAKQIRGDLRLVEDTLFTAIGQPVRLQAQIEEMLVEGGIVVKDWVVDNGTVVSGKSNQFQPQTNIVIGPVAVDDLEDFVVGGKWRQFLEKQLYPALLSTDWIGETQILVVAEQAAFVVNQQTRVGMNTVV